MKKSDSDWPPTENTLRFAFDHALKGLPKEIEPPSGFASAVMTRIKDEGVFPETMQPIVSSFKISLNLRRWIAVAALVALSVTGGSGVYLTRSQSDASPSRLIAASLEQNNKPPVANETSIPILEEKHPAVDISPDHVSVETVEQAGTAAGPGLPGSTSIKPDETSAPLPNSGKGADTTAQDQLQKATLLSKPLISVRSFYRFSVPNLEEGVAYVNQLLEQEKISPMNAAIQESQGQRIYTWNVRVPVDRMDSVILSLSKVGAQLEKKLDSQDISALYRETSDLVAVLESQLQQPKENHEELVSRLASLKQQLAAWDQEVNEQSLVIWIEKTGQ